MNATVRTVLIVQNDYTLRRALESVLAAAGHRVLATGDPDTAYEILTREMVDAVLLDADLPVMSGPALYLAIVHRWPGLLGRIAITTDDAYAEQLRPWLEINPCPILPKPFRFDLVARWLETALRPKDTSATG